MRDHILTVEEVRAYGRPISPKVSEEKLLSYIYETERLSVKPLLGDRLFSIVMEKLKSGEVLADEDPVKMLLDGGEYTDQHGGFHIFSGLKMAMSYYVYAQYVMDGDFQPTRAGMVVKEGGYSQHISSKERSDCYNNALSTAQSFMNEVVLFVRHQFPDFYRYGNTNAASPQHSIIIRKIGE
ncbi:MAG: hypothetical protein IJM04_04325 [Prevotella sp.]|nr:hypothetical protein [Prevotella sp.]